MHRMGEAVTEQLHIEVKAKVLQNVRFKYACRHCDRTGINTPVILAPMPAQPLPGSIATASTLAFALVHKYVDGTPLYRLAQAFERAGVPVSRGALGHWVIGSSERHLSRIYDALKLRLRAQPLIHGDETTVQVLKEKDKEATSTSFMWAYRSGEDSGEPIVLLDYQPGRGQIYPQAFLGDYRGILMSDGYTAWCTLAGATHIGCMAHSRRRFIDALKTRKKGGGPPEQALKFFEQLYRIESQAKNEKPEVGETQADCIRRFRQQHSVPILIALKAWLDDIAPKVLPDSKIGDAVSYTLNQWEYLTRYTEDGRMSIDNNLLERDIRIFATQCSLYTPSSSICKHWNLTFRRRLTRAPFTPHRSGDARIAKMRGVNLVRSPRDNLLGRQYPGRDQAANAMSGDVAGLGSFGQRQPFSVFLR